jgi:hypothetical protein
MKLVGGLQEECYDHLLRHEREFEKIRNCIEENPVRAGLVRAAHDPGARVVRHSKRRLYSRFVGRAILPADTISSGPAAWKGGLPSRLPPHRTSPYPFGHRPLVREAPPSRSAPQALI